MKILVMGSKSQVGRDIFHELHKRRHTCLEIRCELDGY
jgi:dTDP-4-dehydrorhamnose reductase